MQLILHDHDFGQTKHIWASLSEIDLRVMIGRVA
jgi:hypothetical protein